MKTKLIAAVIVIFVIAAPVLIYDWVYTEPALGVYLRCPTNKSGKISMTVIHQNGERGQTKSFELVKACSVNSLGVESYQDGEAVEFILEQENGEKHTIISNRGDNIQSDPSGQFMVLIKITETPPFIENDGI